MEEETKETATPTLAEKMGIKYRKVDGLYYPIWETSDADCVRELCRNEKDSIIYAGLYLCSVTKL